MTGSRVWPPCHPWRHILDALADAEGACRTPEENRDHDPEDEEDD